MLYSKCKEGEIMKKEYKYVNPNKRSKARRKSRTQETYLKKLKRLQSRYNRLAKGEKFKVKYPTFDTFLAKHTLKQAKEGQRRVSYGTKRVKADSNIWGV